jgi:hypothetical protein
MIDAENRKQWLESAARRCVELPPMGVRFGEVLRQAVAGQI